MQIKNNNEMTSLEILDQINIFRKEEGNGNNISDKELELIKESIIDFENFDHFCIFMIKKSAVSLSTTHSWFYYSFYIFISKKLNRYDFEIGYAFYELWVNLKRDETKLHSGIRSEKISFLDSEVFLKKHIPYFEVIKYNYQIKNKFIDLLGIDTRSGEKIIVEFKKGNKCAANQLYSYDRMLNGKNILVSLTEFEVKKKHEGILYIHKF